MENHRRSETLAPQGEHSDEQSRNSDNDDLSRPQIEAMKRSEEQCLQHECRNGASRPRRELAHQIATKDQLLKNARGDRAEYEHRDLLRSFGKHHPRGVRIVHAQPSEHGSDQGRFRGRCDLCPCEIIPRIHPAVCQRAGLPPALCFCDLCRMAGIETLLPSYGQQG